MDRWFGKVAVVTGASSGIGAATSEALVNAGLIVVGIARRLDRLEELANKLEKSEGKFFARQCDITEEGELLNALNWAKSELGGIDILVNNAGVSGSRKTIEDDVSSFKNILNTNVLASAIGIREAVASMKSHGRPSHIININSIYGHSIPGIELDASIYSASKHAITALTETVRKELSADPNNKIKITSLSPGYVKTEIIEVSGLKNRNADYFARIPFLDVEDIADAVLYILGTRPKVHITEFIVRPLGCTM